MLRVVATWVKSISVGIVPKLTGVFRELVIAYYYGANDELGAYILVLSTIGLPLSIYGNAIQNLTLKEITKRPADNTSLNSMLQASMIYLLIISVAALSLMIAMLAVADYVGFGKNIKAVTDVILSNPNLIIYYTSSVILSGLYTGLQASKHHNFQLVFPSVSQIVFTVTILLAPGATIKVLLLALNISTLFEAIAVWYFSKKNGINMIAFGGDVLKNGMSFFKLTDVVKYSIMNALPAVVPLVKQYTLATFSLETLAIINYSSKIPNSLSSLMLSATSTVATRWLITDIKESSTAASMNKVLKNSIALFVITTMICIIFIFFGYQLVEFMFLRGQIRLDDIPTISEFQVYYFIEIPFLVVSMVYWRSLVLVASFNSLAKLTIVSSLGQLIIVITSILFGLNFAVIACVVLATIFHTAVLMYFTKRESTID